jgi:hypothetical protein
MQTASMRFHSTSDYSHQPRPAAVGWPDHEILAQIPDCFPET